MSNLLAEVDLHYVRHLLYVFGRDDGFLFFSLACGS